jgi:uncharacterized membrane protein YbhN (UPF0104 family)
VRRLLPWIKLFGVPVMLVLLAAKLPGAETGRLLGIDPIGLAAALVVNQLALALFAFRMQLALRAFRITLPYWPMVRVHLQSMFYFFVLPMTVGLEIARFGKLRAIAPDRVPIPSLTYALLADRIIGAAAALAIAVAALPAVTLASGLDWAGAWALLAAGGGALAALVVAHHFAKRRLGPDAPAFRDALPWLASTFAVACVTHVCFASGVYLAAGAMHVDIGLMQAVFACSAAMLFVVVPVSFAGVSPVEAATVAVCMALGLPLEQATTVALVSYLAKLVAAFEGGAWEFMEGGSEATRALFARK